MLLRAAAMASNSRWFPEQQVQFDRPSAICTLQLLKPIGGFAARPRVESAGAGARASSSSAEEAASGARPRERGGLEARMLHMRREALCCCAARIYHEIAGVEDDPILGSRP